MHIVKTHRWEHSELIVEAYLFQEAAAALKFAASRNKEYGWLVKVYNIFNELIEEIAEKKHKDKHHPRHHHNHDHGYA